MKNIGKLANRYARALVSAVGNTETMLSVSNELQEFVHLWQTDKQLSFFMLNPVFAKQQRLSALIKILETAGMSVAGRNFIKVVFEHNHISVIAEIVSVYRSLVEKNTNLVRVNIETARGVNSDERHEYEEKLRKKMSGHLVFEWSVKKELLGGMVVSYSGHVFDGSIKGQFEKLEGKMLGY